MRNPSIWRTLFRRQTADSPTNALANRLYTFRLYFTPSTTGSSPSNSSPMAPPLSILAQGSLHRPAPPSFLLPFLQPCPHRHASILCSLRNTPGSYSHRKRLGRGPSSGKGKTAGRGENGQKKKSGTPFIQSLGRPFNGGQTPDEVVRGKRGFYNFFSRDFQLLNLSKLTDWILQGRIDPARPITPRELWDSRCIASPKDGIKLLATGKENLPADIQLNIIVSRASASAIAAVEAAGGKVQTRYYTPFALRKIIRGQMDPVHSLQSSLDEKVWGQKRQIGEGYRLPDPTARKEREYYRDPEKRGYLTHTVLEGQGPSLFFRPPGTVNKVKEGSLERKKRAAEGVSNKLW